MWRRRWVGAAVEDAAERGLVVLVEQEGEHRGPTREAREGDALEEIGFVPGEVEAWSPLCAAELEPQVEVAGEVVLDVVRGLVEDVGELVFVAQAHEGGEHGERDLGSHVSQISIVRRRETLMRRNEAISAYFRLS